MGDGWVGGYINPLLGRTRKTLTPCLQPVSAYKVTLIPFLEYWRDGAITGGSDVDQEVAPAADGGGQGLNQLIHAQDVREIHVPSSKQRAINVSTHPLCIPCLNELTLKPNSNQTSRLR